MAGWRLGSGQWQSGRSGRVGRTARADLVSRFADDPVVTEALELPPSEAAQSRREQAERASTLEPGSLKRFDPVRRIAIDYWP